MSPLSSTIVFLVKIYQKTLSLETGVLKNFIPESKRGVCMYYPSCSNYCILAVKKYGAIKGTILGVKRILSCRPGKEPKVDFP